jgi:hypothetical protein
VEDRRGGRLSEREAQDGPTVGHAWVPGDSTGSGARIRRAGDRPRLLIAGGASMLRAARVHKRRLGRTYVRLLADAQSTGVPPRAASADSIPALTTSTEIVLVSGARVRVEGNAEDVEKQILDAARGSLLELVWLTEAESGQRIALNPEYVVWLRAAGS